MYQYLVDYSMKALDAFFSHITCTKNVVGFKSLAVEAILGYAKLELCKKCDLNWFSVLLEFFPHSVMLI